MDKIIEYLKLLGFEIQEPATPLNEFENIKRNFYIFILKTLKMPRIFYFIRDKYPIKMIKERPDRSVWLSLKADWKKSSYNLPPKTIVEIELIPSEFLSDRCQIKASIYADFDRWSDIMKKDDSTILIYKGDNPIEKVEKALYGIDILASILRDNKLKKLLENG